MVLAHHYIVVWTTLSKDFCVIFQNVTTHKFFIKVLEDEQSKTFFNGKSKGLEQIGIKSFGSVITWK